jgi:hypothetical protein
MPDPRLTRARLRVAATVICRAAPWMALAVTALLLARRFDPVTQSPGWLSCPLRALTGLLCPLCGGLRATHALAHGEVAQAWSLNPWLFGAAPLAIALVVVSRPRPDSPGRPGAGWLRAHGWTLLLGSALVWMIARNAWPLDAAR